MHIIVFPKGLHPLTQLPWWHKRLALFKEITKIYETQALIRNNPKCRTDNPIYAFRFLQCILELFGIQRNILGFCVCIHFLSHIWCSQLLVNWLLKLLPIVSAVKKKLSKFYLFNITVFPIISKQYSVQCGISTTDAALRIFKNV